MVNKLSNKKDADIFCIQESKLSEGQITLDLKGYHQYWNYAEKKGYSGTALFSKEEPIAVTKGKSVSFPIYALPVFTFLCLLLYHRYVHIAIDTC